MSPKVTSPGKESESYSSLKERRKSLTPVIIVLSPSSQILLAECLTDPIGKSFTPHLLHQPSHERSFYLPASISQPFYRSNCSLCSRSAVLSARRKSLAFFSPSDYQSPEACHQHSFENDFTGPCSYARCLFPQITGPRCSCDCPTLGPWSLSQSLLVCSSHSRTHSFARRLFDCPSQEDSSLSFIRLNYYACFVEGEGMTDTSLNNQPPFLLHRLPFVCQLFLH